MKLLTNAEIVKAKEHAGFFPEDGERAIATIEALRDALKPFAALGPSPMVGFTDGSPVHIQAGNLTIGDLRLAVELLAAMEGK